MAEVRARTVGGDANNGEAAATARGGGGQGSRLAKIAADEAAKEDVRRRLVTGEYRIIFVDEGMPDQSPAWKKFGRVVDSKDNKPLKFVQCRNQCAKIKMLTSGRGALATHVCAERPVVLPSGAPRPPSKAAVKEFQMSLAILCAGKLIPPALADAPELKKVIQLAINIGSAYGQVEAGNITPSANTLREVIKDTADKARAILVSNFRQELEDGLCSGTVDGWDGGGLRKRKFYTQTLSTITEDFVMSDNILFTAHCDAQSVTAEVIREALDNMGRLTETVPLNKVRHAPATPRPLTIVPFSYQQYACFILKCHKSPNFLKVFKFWGIF